MQLQKDTRNISMMMDFYEMTMANGYFNNGDEDKVAVFDVFFVKIRTARGFRFSPGLSRSWNTWRISTSTRRT